MAEITNALTDLIQNYITELERHGFHIKAAYLFGSCVNGRADEWSDIDVALVSDDFEGIRFLDKDRIRRITLDVDCRLSPLPYRPEDFTEDDLFVRHLLETGVSVLPDTTAEKSAAMSRDYRRNKIGV